MSEQSWQNNGSYIPFPRPVTSPDGSFLGTPQVSLCFSAAWTPYVIGALKALARKETWAEGDGQDDNWVLEARSMIARIEEQCLEPPPAGINWELVLEEFTGQINFWELVNGGPPNTTASYEGHFLLPDVFGSVDARVDGVEIIDNDLLVGGLFTDLLFSKDSGLEGAMTLITHDCLGHANTITTFTPYHLENVLIKDFRCLALINIVCTATIAGTWVCGPA